MDKDSACEAEFEILRRAVRSCGGRNCTGVQPGLFLLGKRYCLCSGQQRGGHAEAGNQPGHIHRY